MEHGCTTMYGNRSIRDVVRATSHLPEGRGEEEEGVVMGEGMSLPVSCKCTHLYQCLASALVFTSVLQVHSSLLSEL